MQALGKTARRLRHLGSTQAQMAAVGGGVGWAEAAWEAAGGWAVVPAAVVQEAWAAGAGEAEKGDSAAVAEVGLAAAEVPGASDRAAARAAAQAKAPSSAPASPAR